MRREVGKPLISNFLPEDEELSLLITPMAALASIIAARVVANADVVFSVTLLDVYNSN